MPGPAAPSTPAGADVGSRVRAYADPPTPKRAARAQVEISLQPWRAFKPDGVILFSDILTPLAGMNIPFDITAVSRKAHASRRGARLAGAAGRLGPACRL